MGKKVNFFCFFLINIEYKLKKKQRSKDKRKFKRPPIKPKIML